MDFSRLSETTYEAGTESTISVEEGSSFDASTWACGVAQSGDSEVEPPYVRRIENFLKVARWLDSLTTHPHGDDSCHMDDESSMSDDNDDDESDSKPFLMGPSSSDSSGLSSPDENKRKALAKIFGNK